MTDPVVNHALRERNYLIGSLQFFRAGLRHWDTAAGQRGIDEVLAAVDRLIPRSQLPCVARMKQRHRKHRRPVRDTKASRKRAWNHRMANAHPAVIKAWSEALWAAAR